MLNIHLSYKPPSSWRILFLSGGCPRKFSRLKKFRDLVVPGLGFRKGIIIQGEAADLRFTCNRPVMPENKMDVTVVSVHAPRKRNNSYVKTFRKSIYKTRRPEYPHFPILRYERRPLGTSSRTLYMVLIGQF